METDLRLRGVDIGAWHRLERNAAGTPILSSRLLIQIVNGFLPAEHSWFWLAVNRDHDLGIEQEKQAVFSANRSRNASELYRNHPDRDLKAVS